MIWLIASVFAWALNTLFIGLLYKASQKNDDLERENKRLRIGIKLRKAFFHKEKTP